MEFDPKASYPSFFYLTLATQLISVASACLTLRKVFQGSKSVFAYVLLSFSLLYSFACVGLAVTINCVYFLTFSEGQTYAVYSFKNVYYFLTL